MNRVAMLFRRLLGKEDIALHDTNAEQDVADNSALERAMLRKRDEVEQRIAAEAQIIRNRQRQGQ